MDPRHPCYYNTKDASGWQQMMRLTVRQIKTLLFSALKASKHSYVPYTGLAEGASLLSKTGKIYTASKLEIAAYPNSCCAFANVFVDAICSEREITGHNSKEQVDILTCAVIGAIPGRIHVPCGICRQFMVEFGEFEIFLGKCPEQWNSLEALSSVNLENEEEAVALATELDFEFFRTTTSELLPFSSLMYHPMGVAERSMQEEAALQASGEVYEKSNFQSHRESDMDKFSNYGLENLKSIYVDHIVSSEGHAASSVLYSLVTALLDGMKYAYTPYSKFPVCAAILAGEDTVITGCNIENKVFKAGLKKHVIFTSVGSEVFWYIFNSMMEIQQQKESDILGLVSLITYDIITTCSIQEIANAAVCFSYCAERAALSRVVSRGLSDKIRAIAIWCLHLRGDFAKPCGACRQSMVEFGEFLVYRLQYCGFGKWEFLSSSNYDLLPEAFFPESLK